MSDFRIKVSDIFRYILLGCVEAILCVIILNEQLENFDWSSIPEFLNNFPFDPSIIVIISVLSCFYILGYITQLIIQLFFHGNFLGTGIGEMACYIKAFPQCYLNIEKYPFPDWIYYSNAPDRVVEVYKEITESETDSDSKTEYSFANQLFQGIAFSILIFSILKLDIGIYKIITLTLFTVFFYLLGQCATKNRRSVMLNKYLSFCIPLSILIAYIISGDTYIGLLMSVAMLLSTCIAAQLARKQIRRIDILANRDDKELFTATKALFGTPKVFILTRVDDTTAYLLEEQIESVRSQQYPNIKQIILIDTGHTSADNAATIIKAIKKRQHNDEIQYCFSKGSGAASLSHEIRQIFINYATENDITICLDSDDKFADSHVVSRIVTKMNRTQANICLIGFEIFGDIYLNFAKNYHNDLVKRISKQTSLCFKPENHSKHNVWPERNSCITPPDLISADEAHHISTLGWTKCYRKSIAKRFQTCIDEYSRNFNDTPKYEDFPDVIALMMCESRICGISETSIMFRKRQGSATTNMTRQNYESYITYFLKITKEITDKLKESTSRRNNIRLHGKETLLVQGAKAMITEKFIPYKFVQYLNGVYRDTVTSNTIKDYSCDQFFHHFLEEVYGRNNEKQFHESIINILNENERLKIFDDIPKEIEELYKTRKKDRQTDDYNLTIADFPLIAAVYHINIP